MPKTIASVVHEVDIALELVGLAGVHLVSLVEHPVDCVAGLAELDVRRCHNWLRGCTSVWLEEISVKVDYLVDLILNLVLVGGPRL